MASAAQMRWHVLTGRRIGAMFERDGREVSFETGVILGYRTVREPDVSRFRAGVRPGYFRSQWPAADVDLVVEVISPESEKRDRVIKPEEYAAASIPELWLVEPHPSDEAEAMVTIYQLNPRKSYALARTVALSDLESEARS
jgi:Uma2 family endonuclease